MTCYTNATVARNVQYPLLLVIFAVTLFMAFGANHEQTPPHPSHPPTLPSFVFSPPLFSILAPLSTWNVLWHLWNGDPGVWQASPVETQRHEKEGQALLALRAACTYCTFIQIAHDNCNLDVGFWFISFSSDFFFCFVLSWHNQGSGEMDSFFFSLWCFLRLWAEWFVQVDLHRKQGMGISSMFKNDKEWMINRVMLFGLTALVLLLALLWVKNAFLSFLLVSSYYILLLIPVELCKYSRTSWRHYEMSMLVAWTCVSFPLLGLKQI